MWSDRLKKLEEAIQNKFGDNRPQGVPEAWTERGPDGRMIGPPEDANPRAVQLFRQLQAMDDSIPPVDESASG